MLIKNNLTLFWNGIFSNFHSCKFKINDIEFCTSEQAFMYFKAKHFRDDDTAEAILLERVPSKQKKLGRQVRNFDPKTWDKISLEYMYDACYAKFNQNPDLQELLLDTIGTNLVEASPYDTIWGIGLTENNPLAWDRSTWKGQNKLGLVLDLVRDSIVEERI